jgi:aminopeptidase-like protein
MSREMHDLVKRLYPVCRSITGNGVRETLRVLQEYIPIEMHEVPTGTRVFDWTVPKEWNIRDAWVKDASGNKVVDFRDHNLHLLNYSIPVDEKIGLNALKQHLHTLPEQPGLIPYRTSYYRENWGFCLSHHRFEQLRDEAYHVYIDSSLEPGHLTYGELYLKGESSEEIVVTCHVCHPSLANDNLSGIVVATWLAKALMNRGNRFSYRFLFIPGTIGSITWLALNEEKIPRIRHVMVLSCVGDGGNVTWKRTRHGDAEIDRAATHILKTAGDPFDVQPFSPYGYDERQFSSPGINLNAGCFMRSPWGTFPEYHTSADNPDFVQPGCLHDSFIKTRAILNLLDDNRTFINLNPKCEPQLGRRGLYSQTGGDTGSVPDQMAVLWVLNLSDGENSLLDIAERSGIPFNKIHHASEALLKTDLLKECIKSSP